MEITIKHLQSIDQLALAYPFPMHLSQRFTYHLSILQFAFALSQFVNVYLITLDDSEDLERMLHEELNLKPPATLKFVTVSNRRLGFKSNTLWFRIGVERILKKLSDDYESVVVYSRNVKIAAYLASTKSRRGNNLKYAFECHQLFSQNLGFACEFERAQKEHNLEKILYSNVDHLFANNELLVRQLNRFFGAKASVLPVGVRYADILDLTKYSGPTYEGRPYDFDYAGSFDEWKGVECLLIALSSLRLEGWSGKAVLVGLRGTQLKEWREKLVGLGLQFCVDLIERKPRVEVVKYLDDAKIGLIPNSLLDDSVFNTSPLKLFDYAARGLPLVISRVPALDSRTQPPDIFWFRPDDPDSLCESMRRAMALSDDLSSPNLEWVKQFTWQKRAEAVVNQIKTSV